MPPTRALIEWRAASFRLPHGESTEPPPLQPQHNPVVLPLVSTRARQSSQRVSTFTAGCLLGRTGSRPTVVFFLKRKKKVELYNYKADTLVWLLLFFCPNSNPPDPAASSHPRLLPPSSGIVNVWVLPRRRRLVGSLTAHRCCIKRRHANNSFLTLGWK